MSDCYRDNENCTWERTVTQEEDKTARCDICGEHICQDKDGWNIGDDGAAEFWVDPTNIHLTTWADGTVTFNGTKLNKDKAVMSNVAGYFLLTHNDCGLGHGLDTA